MQPTSIIASIQTLTQRLVDAKAKAIEARNELEEAGRALAGLAAMVGAPAPDLEVLEVEESEGEASDDTGSVGERLRAAKKKHGDNWGAIAAEVYGMDTGKNRSKARVYLANMEKKQPKLRAA